MIAWLCGPAYRQAREDLSCLLSDSSLLFRIRSFTEAEIWELFQPIAFRILTHLGCVFMYYKYRQKTCTALFDVGVCSRSQCMGGLWIATFTLGWSPNKKPLLFSIQIYCGTLQHNSKLIAMQPESMPLQDPAPSPALATWRFPTSVCPHVLVPSRKGLSYCHL